MKISEGWFGLVQPMSRWSVRPQAHVLAFSIAPTIQSHKIWNLWQEWEVGKIEGSPNAEARAEAVARVDAMFLERIRQIRIGPSSIFYSRCCSSYYNRLHRDQRFLFDLCVSEYCCSRHNRYSLGLITVPGYWSYTGLQTRFRIF